MLHSGPGQPRGEPSEQDPADVGPDGELQVRRLLPGGVLPEEEPRRHRADDAQDQQAQEERRDRGKTEDLPPQLQYCIVAMQWLPT